MENHKIPYKPEGMDLDPEIDKALDDYFSKSGGRGGNRPDAKCLLRSGDKDYPVMIEYKGEKNKLVRKTENRVWNWDANKNEPHYNNIKHYAINGAVHYANAILQHTHYSDVFSVGMTGYYDDTCLYDEEMQRKIPHVLISVYFVSKSNYGLGQCIYEDGLYENLSFLTSEEFPMLIQKAKDLKLSDIERVDFEEQRESEIRASLVKLNNDIYETEKGLSESDRIYLVVASIMATLGHKPLQKEDLLSSDVEGQTDGDIFMRKVEAFLEEHQMPADKKGLIIRTLKNTLTSTNINRIEERRVKVDMKEEAGTLFDDAQMKEAKPEFITVHETQLKRVFRKIVDSIGLYYKIGLTTDFAGMLFNEMYNWLGFTQDKLNDVVLTPPYVARLMVRLCKTNMNSYVFDNAMGSAGLLVAAMNEMIDDARDELLSPYVSSKKTFESKVFHIRAHQILGLEILPSIYMLAVLNMVLMGDGSSHMFNGDSLKDFDGTYEDSEGDLGLSVKKEFPADVFVLNPPYSAEGNGMVFVESALNFMKGGYAAVIIQNSAGSGKAKAYNKNILKHNTLLASIKMPIDLFLGKSSVQTNIYVFRVGKAHRKTDVVKFIDFSNDGYTRTNRKKARVNLRDTDHAKERYTELVDLVHVGRRALHFFTDKEYYEGTIDPKSGADWNQSAPIDRKPQLADFKKTVSDYLAWEVSNILKRDAEDDGLGKTVPHSTND